MQISTNAPPPLGGPPLADSGDGQLHHQRQEGGMIAYTKATSSEPNVEQHTNSLRGQQAEQRGNQSAEPVSKS